MTSSEPSYINALIQNNSGVVALEKGDFSNARDSFRKALDILTEIIARKELSQSSCAFQWSRNAPVFSTSAAQMTFVYKRALLMVPSENSVDDATRNNDMEFGEESSAIVYNLALSYHLMGLSANRSDILERAMNFYSICNNIRKANNGGKMDIIDLALLNNVGQAQHEFCNYSTARECFDLLTKRLQLLNNHGMIALLERCDCDGFVLNAMLEEPTMAAAA